MYLDRAVAQNARVGFKAEATQVYLDSKQSPFFKWLIKGLIKSWVSWVNLWLFMQSCKISI